MQLCGSLSILWHCLSLGLEWKLTFSSPVASAEFSRFAGILSAALSQHPLLEFLLGFLFMLHIKNNLVLDTGGHGNPLQCSCLENPMDRRAWQATVHSVWKSRTLLKWLSTHPCTQLNSWWNIWRAQGHRQCPVVDCQKIFHLGINPLVYTLYLLLSKPTFLLFHPVYDNIIQDFVRCLPKIKIQQGLIISSKQKMNNFLNILF